MTDDELKAKAWADLEDDINCHGPYVGRIYRHYKGGLYTVEAISIMEDTLAPLVTYRSNIRETSTTRTLGNFTNHVTHEGRLVPRFQWVNE